jgi:hypothetical protein
VEVHFTVTPHMLYRAQREVAQQVPWMRWSGAFVCVAFPLLMLGITVAFGGTVVGALRTNWQLIVGLPIFWLVAIPAIQRWSAGRLLRNTPAFSGPQVTRVDAAGIHTRSSVSTADISWNAIVRVVESKSFFLVFQSKAMALFVPKAAFVGSQDLDQFRQLVAVAVGERASWPAQNNPSNVVLPR